MTTGRPPVQSSAMPDVRGLRIPERTIELLRDLVSAKAGMHYDDGRLDILSDRLAPLAIERGFDSMLDYYYLLRYDAGAAEEWPRVMDTLSVQETYFWREVDQVRALATTIVPRMLERHRTRMRVWSIPCATGEEPLSIAMALEEAQCFGQLSIEICASDGSELALARAARRKFGRRSFRQLPDELREKYFTKDPSKDEWTVNQALFSRVTSWNRVNIVDPSAVAAMGTFDVIFCRNLFIYFTPSGVREVATQLGRALQSPGYLCVGAAESLLKSGIGLDLQDIGGAYVYAKA